MKDSTSHALIAALAIVMIAASLAFYASWVMDWYGGGARVPAAPPAPPPPARTPAELPAARAAFRSDMLDPKAALRLSEALYRAGRPVDSFYVMDEARDFFAAEAFLKAHAAVVLGQDDLASRAPEDPARLARAAADGGRLTEALRQADQGLASHPDDRGLQALKADLVAATSFLEAIPLYARLVNAFPGSYEARQALEKLGRWASKRENGPDGEAARLAREALEELYKAKPSEPRIFSTLAMSAWGRGDQEAAQALVLEARSRKDPNPGAAAVGGALALAAGDADRAVGLFEESWEKDPYDAVSAAKLARIYYRQRGDPEAALPYYIALYRQDPGYADGEPARKIILETLDARRALVLKDAGAALLGRYLQSEDASLRVEACAKAGGFKDARWVQDLGRLLDDDVGLVRRGAADALRSVAQAAPEPVKARRDDWLSAPSPLTRAYALDLFAGLDPFNTFPAVVLALSDQTPTLRFLAKTMVLDRAYKDFAQARKVRSEYLAAEKHPGVLAAYDRMRGRGR